MAAAPDLTAASSAGFGRHPRGRGGMQSRRFQTKKRRSAPTSNSVRTSQRLAFCEKTVILPQPTLKKKVYTQPKR